ncbi:hypothetical protein RHMOL_Rhmol12G0107600 [Rhododendron molle]|uniref:Uncharacterized protein n=1 Tax=Rhododendron molle TaxID=49168 RepID=A0ACC0LH26_RHOML|nr:hypothetical protein RHMOL_Rhmol12G0107600 [Rhododendron molle]
MLRLVHVKVRSIIVTSGLGQLPKCLMELAFKVGVPSGGRGITVDNFGHRETCEPMTISLLLFERAVCMNWFEGHIRVLLCLVLGVNFKA